MKLQYIPFKSLFVTLVFVQQMGFAIDPKSLDFENLTPQMKESLRKAYCSDMGDAKSFIESTNGLILKNNQQLRKGSYARFLVTKVTTFKEPGHKPEREEFFETRKVESVEGGVAHLQITTSNGELSAESLPLTKVMYATVPSSKEPQSCFMWSMFAEKFAQVPLELSGKKVTAHYRQQARISNLTPHFYYLKDVPFSVAKYEENIEFSKKNVSLTKMIIDWKF
jgi:hypothetical protein